MSEADERLIVMLEARISEFEKRMIQAERRGTRTYTNLRQGSQSATRQMERDLALASARINASLGNISAGVGKLAAAFGIGLGVGALQAMAGAARAAVRSMADLADAADRVGLDVETFQGLQVGLGLSGVAADEAASSLENFAQRLGDAAGGQGDLYKTMEKAGVAIKTQSGELRATIDVLRDYAEIVKDAPSAAERMALVTDAFGKGGKAMVLAMSEGAAGIDGMITKARESGVVIDEEMIRKAAELDDKFDMIGARIEAAFKRGVVASAEFFGMVEDQGAAAAAELEYIAADMQGAVSEAVRAIGDEIPYLLEIGADEIALKLSDIVGEMETLAGQLSRGEIEAQDFDKAMKDATKRAAEALAEAQKIDGVDLENAVGAVGRVSEALAIAAGWAREVVAEMSGIPLETSGPSFEKGGRGAGELPSDMAPKSSQRPRKAPVMGGGGGGKPGGGRGGGSSRIEALLADLQTERETLEAWYAESLELLNGATDAQLQALGGRHEAMERLEAEHMDRLRTIRSSGQGGILADAESFFGQMASAASLGGERLVRVQRGFAAAEALINTFRAQSQVLADPTLPWWRKIPAAFAIGAAGMGFVQAIRGGGKSSGGATSAGGGGAAPGGDRGRENEGPLRVLLEGIEPGKLYEGAAVRRMYDALQKEAGNRGMVFVRAGT